MPYHPSFRDKGGYGQTNLLKVLRAYARHDPELGYCEFVCCECFFFSIPLSRFVCRPRDEFYNRCFARVTHSLFHLIWARAHRKSFQSIVS